MKELNGRSTSADIVEAGVEKLREPRSEDFFLFLHFEALHDYPTQSMEGGRMIGSGVNLSESVNLWNPEQMTRLLRARYDQALQQIDDALPPLREELKRLQAEADVVFIVGSGHGEESLEHSGFFHM